MTTFADRLSRFETEAPLLNDEGRWDELTALLHGTIGAAPDAESLWRILMTEPFAWAAYTGDGGLPQSDVECVLARIREWPEPDQRAAGFGIIGALATLELRLLLAPDAQNQQAKRDTLAVLDAQIDAWRAGCEDKSASIRGAAALLLARTPGANADDVDGLTHRLARERAAGALGAAALGLGVLLARRRRGDLALDDEQLTEARRTLTPHVLHQSIVVSCAAAAALALSEGRVDVTTAPPLKNGLRAAKPLPREWGFFDERFAPDSTRDLAADVLAVCAVEPDLVEDALQDLVRGPNDADTLVRLGFGPFEEILEVRGRVSEVRIRYGNVPAGGVARDEITAFQRAVLDLFARIKPRWELRWPLGFSNVDTDIPAFFAAKAPAWRPLEVHDRGGTLRRWHLPLLWRRFVLSGMVERGEAVRAMLAAFDAPAVLDLAFGRMDRFVLTKLANDPSTRERDRELLWGLLDELTVRGIDARADVLGRVARYKPLGPDALEALGAALLHLTEASDPGRAHENARKAIEQANAYYRGCRPS